MPSFCCIKNCFNVCKNSNYSFFRFPAICKKSEEEYLLSIKRRRLWMAAINRKKLNTLYARVCSEHFVSGRSAVLKDILNPDWVPNLKLGYDVKKKLTQHLKIYETHEKRIKTAVSTVSTEIHEFELNNSSKKIVPYKDSKNSDIYCRTCARTFPRQPLVPLFESANPAINAIRRYQNNKFKISTNDGLPQQICSECLNNFNIMNEFLEVCEQSQDKLQNYILMNSKKIDIKIENDDFLYEDEEFLLDELVDESEIADEIKIELITEPILEIDNKGAEIEEHEFEDILSNNLEDVKYNYSKSDDFQRRPRTSIKSSLQKNEMESITNDKVRNMSNSDSEEYFNDDYKEDFTLKCEICSKKFQSFIKLKEHEESQHNKPQRKIVKIMCEMCGIVVEEAFMKDHMDKHIGKTTEYNCEICCRRFFQFKTYKHHVETKHLITTKFHCDICDRGFKMEYNLRNHIKLEHSAGSQQTKPKTTQNLNRPKANLKCYYCSKKFYNTVTLVRHCTTHNKPDAKDAKYNCSYCGTVFKRADHLKIHINTQHLKSQQFKCSYCDKIFYASFVLNRHIKNSHSGLKNTRVTCEFCNKSLATKEYLNRHKLEFHSKEKTLTCPICEEKFFRRVELKAHSKVHDVIINNFEQKDMIIKEFCSEIVEGDRKIKEDNLEQYTDSNLENCNEMNDEQVQMIMEYVELDDEI